MDEITQKELMKDVMSVASNPKLAKAIQDHLKTEEGKAQLKEFSQALEKIMKAAREKSSA